MEFHVRTAPTARFHLPTDSTTVSGATFTLNGSAPVSLSPSAPANGFVTATLPYLTEEGEGFVTWSFTVPGSGTFTDAQAVTVVTPYLAIWEVQEIWPEATAEQAADVEAAVRHVINAHCGQTFGFSKNKTIVVEGHGERALRLPERLLELKGLSTLFATLDINSAIIVSDGWYLKKGWSDEVTALENDTTYWANWDATSGSTPGEPGYEKPGHGHIIVPQTAGGNPTTWRDDYPFTIVGDWGWKSVPEAVKQAAGLLVNDYACMEANYRDRYLESIKAADWRLQFSAAAWENTGNVRADQLLSEYVILDWAVV